MSGPAGEALILYIEVPDFYAEVERRRAPGLSGRPVLVGGDPAKRGKVQSASVEARARGVTNDMSMSEALALCPEAMRLPTDMPCYRQAQGEFDVCIRRIVDALEPTGYGAAYLDGPGPTGTAVERGDQLVAAVRSDLGLPLRVGIGPSKLVARLAAEAPGDTPVRCVAVHEVEAFLAPQPVSCLPRVGKKAERRLAELGVSTIGGVATLGPEVLERELGPRGQLIVALARGDDPTPVRAVGHPRSLSRGETLPAAAAGFIERSACLERLAGALGHALQRQGLRARRLALRVRFTDQSATTRSETLGEAVDMASAIYQQAMLLLERAMRGDAQVHSLGLTVAGLVAAGRADPQLELFAEPSS